MAKRGMLKSALHGFLGTYTSRYSAYDGYWLFGYLVVARDVIERLAGMNSRAGRMMTFDVTAVADPGRAVSATHRMFVAPHDPAHEMQSHPGPQTLWTARP